MGMPAGKGFTWTALPGGQSPNATPLPQGFVFGLMHTINNKNDGIRVLGKDPSKDGSFSGFNKEFGGDIGAPAGNGFCWYESSGQGFGGDFSIVDRLPKGTILGLVNKVNQSNYKLIYNGKTYDASDVNGPTPPGFARKFGGDMGQPAQKGYYWFEKTDGDLPATPQLSGSVSTTISADKKTVDWTVIVANNGSADAVGPFNVNFGVTSNAGANEGPQINAFKNVQVPAGTIISPGKSFQGQNQLQSAYYTCPGAYWVTVLIDPEQKVTQCDRSHNRYEDKNYCLQP